jgi:hypothetical protein
VRLLVAGALVAFVSLLAACGGGGATTTTSPVAQRAEIRGAIRTFLRGLAAADGASACSVLTPAGRKSVIAAIGPELKNFDIHGCEQVVHWTGIQLSAALRRQLKTAVVGAVALAGATATVQWSAITSPAGDVAGFFARRKPLSLVEVDGAWRIGSI